MEHSLRRALVTFAKAPSPGKVKTRLQVDMGAETTVHMYKAFVREILSECSRIRDVDRYLGCAPTDKNEFLRDMARKYNMYTFNQKGVDLGKKIVNAFRYLFRKGYAEIVLIGSDSPTLPKEYIRKAFNELRKNDFVIGPCCDGGMYLVGAKGKMESRVFKDIPWDTSDVLSLVLEKLYALRIPFSLLPFWYDIDNIHDVRFLKLHLKYMKRRLPILPE